jgi:hypothetical protein
VNASTTSSSAPRTRNAAATPPSSCTEDIVVLPVDRVQHGRARSAVSGQFIFLPGIGLVRAGPLLEDSTDRWLARAATRTR